MTSEQLYTGLNGLCILGSHDIGNVELIPRQQVSRDFFRHVCRKILGFNF